MNSAQQGKKKASRKIFSSEITPFLSKCFGHYHNGPYSPKSCTYSMRCIQMASIFIDEFVYIYFYWVSFLSRFRNKTLTPRMSKNIYWPTVETRQCFTRPEFKNIFTIILNLCLIPCQSSCLTWYTWILESQLTTFNVMLTFIVCKRMYILRTDSVQRKQTHLTVLREDAIAKIFKIRPWPILFRSDLL